MFFKIIHKVAFRSPLILSQLCIVVIFIIKNCQSNSRLILKTVYFNTLFINIFFYLLLLILCTISIIMNSCNRLHDITYFVFTFCAIFIIYTLCQINYSVYLISVNYYLLFALNITTHFSLFIKITQVILFEIIIEF